MPSGCRLSRASTSPWLPAAAPGLDHLGIQVETQDEWQEVHGRLRRAERPVPEEGAATGGYARSATSWIRDPQGLSSEAFPTSGESTAYGDSIRLGSIRTVRTSGCGDCRAGQSAGRMKPSSHDHRGVDVMEELTRFTWMLRDRADCLMDRCSERQPALALPTNL